MQRSDHQGRGKVLPLRRIEPAPSDLSDEALVAACAVGDSAALGLLFDRHHEGVYRFLSRLVRATASEADDLVQNTFLEVWRCAAAFSGTGAVKSWIFGVGANVARHHVRSEVRRRAALSGFAEPTASHVRQPDDEAMRSQLVGQVAAALAALPHDLRVAFVLCDLEDVSGVDAARALGLREGTLWRRLHDARRRLRALIEGGRP
jgi:RNA polymerase sigma-70 factor, ECF subfamily